MKFDQRILEAALRSDFESFIIKSQQTLRPGRPLIAGPHISAIAWYLHLCRIGKIKRLIINMPPRYLKSVCASVAFPAFLLGHNPAARVICASFGEGLAGDLSRDCRTVMQSPFYRRLFPQTHLSGEKNTEMYYRTTKGGYRRAVSLGGSITGIGGDFIIIDDPLKSNDALSRTKREDVNNLFDNTILSRLDDKQKGCIIIVMQRLHIDDLTGHLLERGGWTHLNLSAIAEFEEEIEVGLGKTFKRAPGDILLPAYESREILESYRQSMGSYAFSAQYLQRPVPEDGEILKWDWFKTYEVLPPLLNGEHYVMSIDTATKAGELNDYSVFTIWQIKYGRVYLVDVIRRKLLYPELKKLVYDVAQKYPSIDLLIEDSSSGAALFQEIERKRGQTMNRVIAIRPEGDKVTRAATASALIEAGHVYMPRTAPWLEAFRNEVLPFPNGRNDDQVDSMIQFLKWYTGPKRTLTAVDIHGV